MEAAAPAPPTSMLNTSGPEFDASAGRSAAANVWSGIFLNVTWIFGYCLLNALIALAATNWSGVQPHQLMLPEVVELPAVVDDEPLLLHPASASAAIAMTPTAAKTRDRGRRLLRNDIVS